MENIYRYLMLALVVFGIFISAKYYFLSKDYDDLASRNEQLLGNIAIEKANTSILEQAIAKQNAEIKLYKQSSEELENTVRRLNEEIQKYNKAEKDDYVKIDKSENDISSEEAIKWMREKSSSLLQ